MLTRRNLLTAGAFSGAAMLMRSTSAVRAARFETPLPIPQLIDAAASGHRISLTIAQGRHAYWPGHTATSFGYSASVLGPAIRLRRGERVEFTIENRMDRMTTVHWHGLIVPGEVDGGPHNSIAPGNRWKTSLSVDQPETTAWFHPHPHEETAEQVYSAWRACSSWRTEAANAWACRAATVTTICRSCCRIEFSTAPVLRSTSQVLWISWLGTAATRLS